MRDYVNPRWAIMGEGNGRAKLTREQVIDIRSRKLYFGLLKDLAEEFGVTGHTVFQIRNRYTWENIPPQPNECTVKGPKYMRDMPQAKITAEQVKDIRTRPRYHGMMTDMAKEFGVSVNTISYIRNGTRRKI